MADSRSSLHPAVGAVTQALSGFGGHLRCMVCGEERPLGDIGHKLSNGWPKHCGYTMRWLARRELDEERASA